MQSRVFIKNRPLTLASSILVSFLLVLTAVAAIKVTPKYHALKEPFLLEKVIPNEFGQWKMISSPYVQVTVNTDANKAPYDIYDQVKMATYQDKEGHQIMLAIAYASVQKQEIKIHQPEVCYQAAGFKIVRINEHEFKLGNHAYSIKGKQVLFRKANRLEALSYWIRIGEAFPQSGMAMRLKILYEGLKGKIDDGVLVRVSTIIDDESQALEAYQLQGKFLAEFVKVTAMVAPSLLVP